MSTEGFPQVNRLESVSSTRVLAFVDGFNLYHALEEFKPARPVPDPDRYRKYKWLCLTSLVKRFLKSHTETLVGVEYFTAIPNWHNTESKQRRHQLFISAQKHMGVRVTLGEFRPKEVECKAKCRYVFQTYVEKQTDTNIAVAMIDRAATYDKAILITGDSDQVPAIRLLRSLYPEKVFAVLPPIGRGAKELQGACHESFKMTEEHLAASQLPTIIDIKRPGLSSAFLVKPSSWP